VLSTVFVLEVVLNKRQVFVKRETELKVGDVLVRWETV
jgi:hypothetical protein